VPAASQSSVPLQTSLSAQLVPAAIGSFCTPLTGSQLSAVHGLPSSGSRGALGWQPPVASQSSVPLQTSLSAQLVPAVTGVFWTPLTGSQLSAVPQMLPPASAARRLASLKSVLTRDSPCGVSEARRFYVRPAAASILEFCHVLRANEGGGALLPSR
jgi:hypothetical protein